MMRLRISLRAVMALVVLVAVVFAAWNGATPAWASVVFNLTVLTLLFASYEARYSRGSAGAWWFGFALCGWASLVLSLATDSLHQRQTYLQTPTDALLSQVLRSMRQGPLGSSPNALEAVRSRYLIVKTLLTVPNALVGGALVRYLATRRQRAWDEGR